MRWEASSYYWDTPTTLAPREASHFLLLRFLVKRNNLKGELIYVYLYTYLIRANHGYISLSPVFVCVCVRFFPLVWVYLCYNWFSGRCVCLFSIFQVCLFVYLFEGTECWIPRVHALVGQLVFVGVDEMNLKFLSTRTNFALLFWCFLFQGLKTIYEQVVGPRERRRVLFLAHDRLLFCWQMPIQTCPGEQRCRSKKGGGQVWRKTSSDYPTEPMKKKQK